MNSFVPEKRDENVAILTFFLQENGHTQGECIGWSCECDLSINIYKIFTEEEEGSGVAV